MTKTLRIAENLTLPLEAVTQTFGIVAKRGAGKTNTAVDMAEEMLEAKQQIIVVDPVGVWYGLRSDSTGKGGGYAILVLGGDHGDIPIDPSLEAKQQQLEGERIAQIVVEHRLSVILDLSDLRKNKQYAFLTGFFETIYRINRNAVHIFMDEADAYAPQQPFEQTKQLLGAVQDLVRRGRAKGIGITLISQRIAALSKDVLTQIEVLICLRTVGKHDLDAIHAWVRANADETELAKLKDDLPTLPIGTGWLWSPGWLQKLVKVHFRKRRTFDSSATPKVGEIRQQPKKLADISIGTMKTLFAPPEKPKPVVKERVVPAQVERVEVQVEVSVLTEEDRDLLRITEGKLSAVIDNLQALGEQINMLGIPLDAILEKAKAAQVAPVPRALTGGQKTTHQVAAKPVPVSTVVRTDTGLTAPQMRILNSLVTAHRQLLLESVERGLLAIFSNYTPKTPAYRNNLYALHTAGLIQYSTGDDNKQAISATPAGFSLADPTDIPSSLEDYQELWLARLTAPQRRIMEYLLRLHPHSISKKELAPEVQYTDKTPAYRNNLYRLTSLGMVKVVGTEISVTDMMYPKGLTQESTHG